MKGAKGVSCRLLQRISTPLGEAEIPFRRTNRSFLLPTFVGLTDTTSTRAPCYRHHGYLCQPMASPIALSPPSAPCVALTPIHPPTHPSNHTH